MIVGLIEPRTKVLDLGCGDGTLLSHLIEKKECHGTGIEIDEKEIYKCVEKGLTVSHDNFDTGIADFADRRFDYVILNESLQEILDPRHVILEALRVGKRVVVGIPNFCTLNARMQIFFNGRVPVTSELPHEWYNTPNLRFLSLKDFRAFCRDNGIKILREVGITKSARAPFMPNLFAQIGIYLLEK